jgi:hypothetical protein
VSKKMSTHSKAHNMDKIDNMDNMDTFLFLGSIMRFSGNGFPEGVQLVHVVHAFPRARAREGWPLGYFE